jgi:dynein heavy chain 1, cytosolic
VFAPSNSSTAAAVTFITFVQDLKKKTKAWGPMIDLCASGEKTLERFRYQFPEDWLYSDQLRGEWSAYNEILKRKSDSIQEQLCERLILVALLQLLIYTTSRPTTEDRR